MGDVRVVHERQRLPLGFEAGHHLLGIHARLEHLESDLAADRLLLLRHVDDAEAALADLLQQLVRPDHRAGVFGVSGSSTAATRSATGDSKKLPARSLADRSDSTCGTQLGGRTAGPVEILRALGASGNSSACRKISLALGFQAAMTAPRDVRVSLINARNGPKLHAVRKKYRRLPFADLLVEPGSR